MSSTSLLIRRSVSAARRSLRRLKGAGVLGVVAALFLLVLITASLVADIVDPFKPYAFNIYDRNLPPELGTSHPLGTNYLGQDLLRLILEGAQTSLTIGFLTAAIAGLIGTVLGVLAGYHRSWVDHLVMRVVDLQMAFPAVMLALFVLTTVGAGFVNLVIVLAISRWPVFARVSRGRSLQLREQDFVEAARCVGAGSTRIMRRHIFPNLALDLLTLGVLEMARAMLAEGGLSFLGVGIQSPEVSWGLMLAQGQPYIGTAWWNVAFPGLALMLSALSLNYVAIWLRRLSDPVQSAGRHRPRSRDRGLRRLSDLARTAVTGPTGSDDEVAEPRSI